MQAERVMAFLQTEDVATAVLTKDPLMVKGALFDAMERFTEDAALQLKYVLYVGGLNSVCLFESLLWQ
jgi:hypothetical protein